jgi:Ca2+-binding RTX toxin-like protein
MNGGTGPDFIQGNAGTDILRGQDGDDTITGVPRGVAMFGGTDNDKINGGEGEDGLAGEEGSDQHYGGEDDDFIDAALHETVNTPDLVDGGAGFDVCLVNENDTPVVNCERIQTFPNP